MIPALATPADPDTRYRQYLDALAAAGFKGELSSSPADRTVLATDNSVYQLPPRALLFPRDTADVVLAMQMANDARFTGLVFAARGGGTGTNGQSLTDGVMLDLSRHMNAILEVNVEERWARVQAGAVKDDLNKRVAANGLFFTPELSTSNRATIGGMINTDASGQGSIIYGKTRNHVLELTSVLTDGTVWRSAPLEETELTAACARTDRVGEIHRVVDGIQKQHGREIEAHFPKLTRCLTGYDLAHIRDAEGRFNLNSILCGSEGTLAVITEAKVNLMPIPKVSALILIGYDDFDATLRDAHAVLARKPASVEAIDARVLELARQDVTWPAVHDLLPLQQGERPTRGVNVVEFVGDSEAQVEASLQSLARDLDAGGHRGRQRYTIARGERVAQIWAMRKRAAGMLGNMPGEKRPITFVEDTAVPPENLADYIAEFRALLDAHGLDYGMFGHVDAGVLHVRPAIDMKDPVQATLVRTISDRITALTQKYGGVLWGEHGKGMRSEYAPSYFGALYAQVQAVKAVFDAANRLNPGKVATPGPQPLLKLDAVPTRGALERTVPSPVREGYADAVFCNGNGSCYNFDPDDAMCPSWKGTRERRHSPKGRATLTREWLRRLSEAGTDPLTEARRLRRGAGWRHWPARVINTWRSGAVDQDFSHLVKEAMDGCLACKSCTSGCPLKVDVPAFRSRFLELYHGRYLRPAKDHLVGALEHLLPTAARLPALYNAVLGSPLGRALFRRAGLADLPRIASGDFAAACRKRGVRTATPALLRQLREADRAQVVVLVPDAFTRYFETPLLLDVIDLLRKLGRRVYLAPYMPSGKALHVHGFLRRFEAAARRQARSLKALADTGVPLIGIDPSVVLAFRTEYHEALGKDAMPPVLLLQEWLAAQSWPERSASTAPQRARLIAHCTERALAPAAVTAWRTVFARCGVELELVAAGCCGMAGTYGHEVQHLDTSRRIYDLSWRRHVQVATPLLATGFSCRSQAKRFDARQLSHPVQALLAALG